MRVIIWPRSDSDGSCVNKKGRGYKGFYSIQEMFEDNFSRTQSNIILVYLHYQQASQINHHDK